jgi:hypothetical protein
MVVLVPERIGANIHLGHIIQKVDRARTAEKG